VQDAENFAESIAETMAELGYSKSKATGILQSIKDFFVNLKNAITSYLNKKGSDKMITAEGKHMAKHADMEFLDNLLELYNQGMREVRNNYDAYVRGEHSGEVDSSERFMYDSDKDLSIKKQLNKYKDLINENEIVCKVHYVITRNNLLIKDIIKMFKEYGYAIERENFGKIEVKPEQLKRGISYLHTDGEKAAMYAIYRVIKHGKIISGHDDHKSRSYDTVTIAAPIEINKEKAIMGVVIRLNNGAEYYTHRILNTDGTKFKIKEIKNDAEPTSYVLKEKTFNGTSIGSAYNKIITENYDFVKMDEDYFTAIELGDESLVREIVDEALKTSKMSLTDSSELIVYDDNGDIVPLSKRLFKDDNVDFQFLGDEDTKATDLERMSKLNRDLQKRNDAQADMIKTLQRQVYFFNRGDFSVLDHREVQKMAKQLIKNTGAKVSADKLGKRLSDLYDMMAHESSENAAKIQRELQSIATELINSAEAVNIKFFDNKICITIKKIK